MTKSKLKRARENSHMAINIAEKPDKERTADDNFIIN